MPRVSAWAFGTLHRWLAGCDGATVTETLPGFHDSAARLARLEQAVREDRHGRVAQVGEAIQDARERRGFAEVVPSLTATGALPRRVVHNDAKAGNVLLDASTGAPLAVIDLDTVMPGTLLSDVGDLIRSLATRAPEDERERDWITVERPLVESLARGFLAECGGTLVAAEREQFIFAGRTAAHLGTGGRLDRPPGGRPVLRHPASWATTWTGRMPSSAC